MAFTDFPEQWQLFKAQRPKTTADEIIRWASPINAFQRTAMADTELNGAQIKKGQRLVLFYRSANFEQHRLIVVMHFGQIEFKETRLHWCERNVAGNCSLFCNRAGSSSNRRELSHRLMLKQLSRH